MRLMKKIIDIANNMVNYVDFSYIALSKIDKKEQIIH